MRQSTIKYLLLILLVALLFAVRYYEAVFYDPLLVYYKQDFLHKKLVDFNTGKLVVNLFFRYTINGILSLGILWVLFKDKSYMVFSFKFYAIAFLVLLILFLVIVSTDLATNKLMLFYVRRFIIQPLFLLILIPSFYYQKEKKRE